MSPNSCSTVSLKMLPASVISSGGWGYSFWRGASKGFPPGTILPADFPLGPQCRTAAQRDHVRLEVVVRYAPILQRHVLRDRGPAVTLLKAGPQRQVVFRPTARLTVPMIARTADSCTRKERRQPSHRPRGVRSRAAMGVGFSRGILRKPMRTSQRSSSRCVGCALRLRLADPRLVRARPFLFLCVRVASRPTRPQLRHRRSPPLLPRAFPSLGKPTKNPPSISERDSREMVFLDT